ncbi:MAG: sodium:proton antiporter, partial [Burkholderiaceae bacterium]
MRAKSEAVKARCLAVLMLAAPQLARAAEFDATQLGLVWVVPFAGLLLSIALLPLFAPQFWHRFYGSVAVGWAALTLLPLAIAYGAGTALEIALHSLLLEYLPFIIFIATLYVVAGGIFVRGNLHGSPALNTSMLALGGGLASLMGTTGAAMLLIRPVIRANDNRRYRAHTIIFFIFIVANAGGALTPLGDPPLFLGFLKGVSFFWTLQHMLLPTLLIVGVLLAMFFVVDTFYYRRDVALGLQRDPTPDDPRIGVDGKRNFVLLALVVAAVLMSGIWKSGIEVDLLGNTLTLEGLLRDAIFIVLAAVSLWLTPRSVRQANEFTWHPIEEVAKLFFGIFLTMAPVLL